MNPRCWYLATVAFRTDPKRGIDSNHSAATVILDDSDRTYMSLANSTTRSGFPANRNEESRPETNKEIQVSPTTTFVVALIAWPTLDSNALPDRVRWSRQFQMMRRKEGIMQGSLE